MCLIVYVTVRQELFLHKATIPVKSKLQVAHVRVLVCPANPTYHHAARHV